MRQAFLGLVSISIAIGLCHRVDAGEPQSQPLKVFILAGQSNMQGHAKAATLDYLADDPTTAPWLAKIRQSDGTPIKHDLVRISYLSGDHDKSFTIDSALTTGFGARRSADPIEQTGEEKIGPELTFGITIQQQLDQPILLIKTAWGGKSLYYDFRPPSAGVYQRTEQDIEKNRHPADKSGHYYRQMIDHIQQVLSAPQRVHPSYDPSQGYEIAGFVWFQGWNDMVNRNVYPQQPADSNLNRFHKYSETMAALIRDVRRDLDVPKMPLVIGVMGVGGDQPNEGNAAFRAAMAAPASLPEFAGNVLAVPTAPFWDASLGAIANKRGDVRQMAHYLKSKHKKHANADGKMTKDEQRAYVKKFEAEQITPAEQELWQRGASNAGYHYLGCAKTFVRMGEAFAEAILSL